MSHVYLPVVVRLGNPPCEHIELSLPICRGVSIDNVKLNHEEDSRRDVEPRMPLKVESLVRID